MSREEDVYMPALQGKHIPILTQDEKWKLLFGEEGTTPEIDELEKELNELLDRQSELRQKSKDIKRLKKTLLDEVIHLSDQLHKGVKGAETKLDEHKRLIEECNVKTDEIAEQLTALPRQIYDTNFKLMVETMNICYEKMHRNTDEINVIDEWLVKMRKELKKQVIRLQEGEMENFNMYSYMRQIFGPDVVEIFDMQYDPEREHRIRTPSMRTRQQEKML
ncbi:hypothetical protein [Butyrivibrio sp. NC3005]|jgi:septal ring factor EnvC (AmiA/AmiB activator)|uniref:hypothetical protein n=1 Tax=Butyrivibrio sp. NC3005 TaxID=1280685 RepID=UPI00040944B8|nr:hypothetical protein [Butyrivibrio sp. NC3005]